MPLRNKIYTNFVEAYADGFYGLGKVLEILRTNPYSINSCDDKGRTLLHHAANCGDFKLLDSLTNYKYKNGEYLMDLNACDIEGNTPASLAAKNHHGEFVSLLADLGADLYLKGGSLPSAIERLKSEDATDTERAYAVMFEKVHPQHPATSSDEGSSTSSDEGVDIVGEPTNDYEWDAGM